MCRTTQPAVVGDVAFRHAGLDYRDHVVEDPALIRPAEVDHLLGDASLAQRELGWVPTIDFQRLFELMVDADLERHRRPAPARSA